jgi:DNA-directed RNA polymerase specialized sigma24 family protein
VRVEGFSMAAAAENLGVTVASLKMSVFRGAAALRGAARDGEAGADAPPSDAKEDLRGLTRA